MKLKNNYMKKISINTLPKNLKYSLIILGVFLVILFIVNLGLIGLAHLYSGKIMSGVKVDDLNLSGMTPEQAEQIIGNKISKIYDSGLKFKYNEVEKDIPIIGENNLVIINVQKIIAEAYNTGRNGNIFIKNLDRLQLVLFGKTVQVNYELSKNKLQENLIYE